MKPKENPQEEEERLIVPFNTVTWPAASAITNWFDPIRVAATYEGFNLAPATARILLRFSSRSSASSARFLSPTRSNHIPMHEIGITYPMWHMTQYSNVYHTLTNGWNWKEEAYISSVWWCTATSNGSELRRINQKELKQPFSWWTAALDIAARACSAC